jgi:hypothetical protein
MLLNKERKLNTGKKFNKVLPMNLFPSYPFLCKCGTEAEYAISIDNDGNILHKIKCSNCKQEASGITGEQANDMWFGYIPGLIDSLK